MFRNLVRTLAGRDKRTSRESVLSVFWVVVTLLLLLLAGLITTQVAHVEDWDPPNGYSVGFYVSKSVAQSFSKESPVELTVVRINGTVEFDFRWVGTSPSTPRVVFLLRPFPRCERVSGLERVPLKAQVVEGYGRGWSYVDVPSNDFTGGLTCQVADFIHAPSFLERNLFFSVEDTVGKPAGFLAMPVELNMSYYEVMSDNHFFVGRYTRQIDSRNYTFRPRESALFEWTSARQMGREIYLLVIVGALIAVAATTLIEAIRFWLSMLIGRIFPPGDASQ